MHSTLSVRVFRFTSRLWNKIAFVAEHPLASLENFAHPEAQKKGRHAYSDSEPRPRYRGSLVAWLHRTALWAFIALAYMVISFFSLDSVTSTLFRVKFALVTLWGLWASDYLHNLDRIIPGSRKTREETEKLEQFYLKHDLISISSIMTANCLVWSDRLGFAHHLPTTSVLSVACTIVTACVILFMFHHYGFAFATTRAIMAFQFLGICGYTAVQMVQSDAWRGPMMIWLVYGVGLLAYIAKPFLGHFQTAGPHEAFHLCVFSGHLLSMVMDVILMFRAA